ncbi:ATP-dependent DNA helicase RecG [Corynebacterium testudinoris]|uniref:ATP-dependent DNA helicase RecG n=1 Tax=Corynebacterium testudinoris TaxID=136857 RepID=UPI001C8B3058|nr:ATP-dependent DNA helicase RecG [Corynebacterium testudinoris]MBX8996593.1 ATP-dependent DNA helicase RecG [Corynebacterium testudinoris]
MLGWSDDRLLTAVLPAKEAKAITSAFGYETCGELLEHFPRAYSRHGSGVLAEDAEEGDMITCVGEVTGVTTQPLARGNTVTRVTIDDGRTVFTASFFHSAYVANILHRGVRAMFAGKLKFFRGTPQLQHPDFIVIPEPGRKGVGTGSLKSLEAYGDPDELLSKLDYVPVYPATSRINSWRIMSAIQHVLATLPPIPEPLGDTPEGMVSFDHCIRGIHLPGPEGPEPNLRRFKYNEAITLGLVMALRRLDTLKRVAPALPATPDGYRAELLGRLPYELTAGQEEVLADITADISADHPMSRLLQGEVGSGKTIVSLLAMLQAVDAGRQCALLAPTEVLAVQHARTLTALLADAAVPATVVPLTGSMPVSAKRQALLDIVSGQADIVVGTHAIIQDSVEFFDLGLVVVDEQHRFGVEQRDRLRTKGRDGITPHLLVMTATPIPRTIAMTVFGDLSLSTLKELPGGRVPIHSSLVPESRPTWVHRALQRIREEIDAGHQAYIVCPRIDGDGGVLDFFEVLSSGPFADYRIGILHGRMPTDAKDEVMGMFVAGELDILIATTVIEVGVDVPNASIMLVREADHFGVSQLHQLRGRVGRGARASLCLFHTFAEPGSPGYQRLEQIAATTDGFALAELDLYQRQEGDVLGTSQSGAVRTVKLLNLLQDIDIITLANADAAALVDRHPLLAQRLVLEIDRDDREYLEKS